MAEQNQTDSNISQPVEPRKATDVLLSIEKTLSTLVKMVAMYDTNSKLILSRVNDIHAYVSQIQFEYEQEKRNQVQNMASAIPQVQERVKSPEPEQIIQVIDQDKNLGARRGSRSETYSANSPPTTMHIPIQNLPITTPTNVAPSSKNSPWEIESPKLNVPKQQAPVAQQKQENQEEFKEHIQKPKKPTTVGGSERKVPVIQRVVNPAGKDSFMAEVNVVDENNEHIHKLKTNATGKWQAHLRPGKYSIHIVKTESATKEKIESLQEIVVPDQTTVYNLPTIVIQKRT